LPLAGAGRHAGAVNTDDLSREPTETGLRYARAQEFVDVVKGLWNCWEDGCRRGGQGGAVPRWCCPWRGGVSIDRPSWAGRMHDRCPGPTRCGGAPNPLECCGISGVSPRLRWGRAGGGRGRRRRIGGLVTALSRVDIRTPDSRIRLARLVTSSSLTGASAPATRPPCQPSRATSRGTSSQCGGISTSSAAAPRICSTTSPRTRPTGWWRWRPRRPPASRFRPGVPSNPRDVCALTYLMNPVHDRVTVERTPGEDLAPDHTERARLSRARRRTRGVSSGRHLRRVGGGLTIMTGSHGGLRPEGRSWPGVGEVRVRPG
jgi:hypothetical protein